MYTEHLAILLLLAAAQGSGPVPKAHHGPFLDEGRQSIVRAVKEPELVAALSLRGKRPGPLPAQAPSLVRHTLFASAR